MNVGERVVYPMHGAGIVLGVEESEVGGVVKSYYVLQIPVGNLKLMLPADKIEEIGLRDVIEKEKISEVAEVLAGESDDVQGSWNKRFHATLDRMKSGDILEVAAVARNLSRQHLKRKISGGERRLLELSRQILISELIFAMDKPQKEVSEWVDEKIGVENIETA